MKSHYSINFSHSSKTIYAPYHELFNDFESFLKEGEALIHEKKYEEAIVNLNLANDINRCSYKVYHLRALALMEIGKNHEALDDIKKAIHFYSSKNEVLENICIKIQENIARVNDEKECLTALVILEAYSQKSKFSISDVNCKTQNDKNVEQEKKSEKSNKAPKDNKSKGSKKALKEKNVKQKKKNAKRNKDENELSELEKKLKNSLSIDEITKSRLEPDFSEGELIKISSIKSRDISSAERVAGSIQQENYKLVERQLNKFKSTMHENDPIRDLDYYLGAKQDIVNYIYSNPKNRHDLTEAWKRLGILFACGERVIGLPAKFISRFKIHNEEISYLYAARYCFGYARELAIKDAIKLNEFHVEIDEKIKQFSLRDGFFAPQGKTRSKSGKKYFNIILNNDLNVEHLDKEQRSNKRVKK